MPLTLGSTAAELPEDYPALLELLAARPQPAVVWYGAQPEESAQDAEGTGPSPAEPERIELSGRVLQNWAVKLIGLLTEELDPAPQDVVVIDTAPHWKAAAVVLAAAALGSEVRIIPRGSRPTADLDAAAQQAAEEAALIVSDRPNRWAEVEALGDAELAALSPGMLDESFDQATGEQIPSWALDVSAEVRQHPDQLLTALSPHPLPRIDPPADDAGSAVVLPQRAAGAGETAWKTWQALDWDSDVVPALMGAWARGRTVVLWDGAPAGPGWEAMLRNEAVR